MHARQLRGALVGAGYFGSIQADAWQQTDGAVLAAVCDIDSRRAGDLAERYGIKAYTDAQAMIESERPDYLDIATRPDTHLELVRLAAAAGLPAICQKPIAPSLEDAEALVGAAAAAGIRLMIHENFRWQPWYRVARELIANGAVGEIFTIAFRLRAGDGRGPDAFRRQPYFRQMPRLLIYETLTHQIDVTRFLGGEPVRVFARTRRLNPALQGEDLAIIHMELASGALVLIDANRHTDPPEDEAEDRAMATTWVEGTDGQLTITRDGRLRLRQTGAGQGREIPLTYDPDSLRGGSTALTQQHFIDCLLSGAPFETGGEEYLQTTRVVFACYKSAETGLPVIIGS